MNKYFNGEQEISGPGSIKNERFQELFPGIKGKRYDSFSRYVGWTSEKEMLPVTRIVYYKDHPSLHKCDSRCRGAKGHDCECSCGGKYHGIDR